jgi:hypothetical protein
VGLYLLTVARHPLAYQDNPRVHERYLFPVGPLVITAFLAAPSRHIGRTATVAVLAAILLTVGPLGHLVLTHFTWVDAPSLTAPWLARRALRSGSAAAILIGSMALLVIIGVRRARGGALPGFAWLAGLLLLLNAGWYAELYHQTHLNATVRVVHNLQARLGPTDRITVVQDGSVPLERLCEYLKFWLDSPVTGYWVGNGSPSYYADLSGPPEDAADRTGPSYIVAPRGFEALCPRARSVPGFEPNPSRIVVLKVPKSGCVAPT